MVLYLGRTTFQSSVASLWSRSLVAHNNMLLQSCIFSQQTVNNLNDNNEENIHFPKPADQEWTPPLPFYDSGWRKFMCTRIFQTQLELKQNVVENKWLMSAWIKSNPISVVPSLTINLSHLGWPPVLWYPILFFAWLCFAKFLDEIISAIIIRC